MKKVLVIIGPTAVGKTALSIDLAKKLNGEIINGDSVQIYKDLNIGSAKIKFSEMEGIPHHLLDIKEPSEEFSVAEFQDLVRKKIDEISNKGKLPIIAGGTGLYIQAVLYDFRFEEERRSNELNNKYERYSNEELHSLLEKIDYNEAKKIHVNNRRRVLRAIEIYDNNQKTKSELIEDQSKKLLYDAYIIGLDMDREILYERINHRVDIMIKDNLIEEVKRVYEKGIFVNAIGYKEFNEYFNHEKTFDDVISDIKKNTRHYAKRQLTYFRNKLDVNWFKIDNDNKQQLKNDILADVINWLYNN